MESLLSDYLTEQQLAEQRGLSRRQVTRWRIERIGPPFTFVGQDRDPRYRIEAVRQGLLEREQKMPRERTSRRITNHHTAA